MIADREVSCYERKYKKIQSGLYGIINDKIKFSFIKDFAHILIFVHPIHSLLYVIPYTSFLYTILAWTDALCYIASLLGLLICFAKNDFKKIGVYFILSAAPAILNLFRRYSFNSSFLIYVAFYIFLAVCALRYNGDAVTYSAQVVTPQPTPTPVASNAPVENKCAKYDNILKGNASFCGVC